jgi:four helix bundle protein
MIELGKGNVAVDKSFNLALSTIAFCDQLEKKGKLSLANQLLRSGTAVGALVAESQDAESRADFIHKMKIALKEAKETHYWVSLCEKSPLLPFEAGIKSDCEDVIRILSKIVVTTRENDPKAKNRK